MGPADSDRVLRAPPYSGVCCSPSILRVRDYHPLWPAFPDLSTCNSEKITQILQPRHCRNSNGLGSFAFDRHYSRNRSFLSFPAGIEMFQFPAFALLWLAFSQSGCPIRTPPDQVLFADPRRFSQLTTSFFATRSQGILRSPL